MTSLNKANNKLVLFWTCVYYIFVWDSCIVTAAWPSYVWNDCTTGLHIYSMLLNFFFLQHTNDTVHTFCCYLRGRGSAQKTEKELMFQGKFTCMTCGFMTPTLILQPLPLCLRLSFVSGFLSSLILLQKHTAPLIQPPVCNNYQTCVLPNACMVWLCVKISHRVSPSQDLIWLV